MHRLLPLVLLAICQQSAFAAVYRCDREGGKVEYQSTPCPKGRELTITSAKQIAPITSELANGSKAGEKKCIGKELRMNFTSMPVKATLQVIADYAGNKLVADPSISGVGAFHYDCVPWNIVLQDIATRYHLVTTVENGTIFAKRR